MKDKSIGTIIAMIAPPIIFVSILLYIIINSNIIENEIEGNRKNEFANCQREFEIINEFILNNVADKQQVSFMPWDEDIAEIGDVTTLIVSEKNNGEYSDEYEYIELTEELRDAINTIQDNLLLVFHNICYDKGDVYYYIGRRQYVYSHNGKRPTYLNNNSNDKSYDTYQLNEHWYLLEKYDR